MGGYAMLQLLPRTAALAQEHIIYLISSHMDERGLMPCDRESAERTVSFARFTAPDGAAGRNGWAVFDDEADRLDAAALDGLGRCLTRRLPGGGVAVGVMGEGTTRLLRLYRGGRTVDTYITVPGSLGRIGRWITCRGRAVRWRALLPGGIAALSAAFELGQQDAPAGFAAVRRELRLHDSCAYGFASLEDAGLPGVVTLYFCAANHVRQRWFDRLLHPQTRRQAEAGVTLGGAIRAAPGDAARARRLK